MPDDVTAMLEREYLRDELLRQDMPICARSVMSDDPDRLAIPPSVAFKAIEAAIIAERERCVKAVWDSGGDNCEYHIAAIRSIGAEGGENSDET